MLKVIFFTTTCNHFTERKLQSALVLLSVFHHSGPIPPVQNIYCTCIVMFGFYFGARRQIPENAKLACRNRHRLFICQIQYFVNMFVRI